MSPILIERMDAVGSTRRAIARHTPPAARAALAAIVAAILAAPLPLARATDEPFSAALHDGDILHVCDGRSPLPGQVWMRGHWSTGESTRWGTLSSVGARIEAGLHPRLSAGMSLVHQTETLERASGPTLRKQGLGDTRLFCKWRVRENASGSAALFLRPALRIPTGYDRDEEDLAPFTTRAVDFEALAIASIGAGLADVSLNAGIALPGGRRDNEALAGFGLRGGPPLPYGLGVSGEYFARYDIATEDVAHEVFIALACPLPRGLTIEAGVRKRLLEDEESGAEFGLRLSHGIPVRAPRTAHRPETPRRPYPRLRLMPLTSAVPDPYGIAGLTEAYLAPDLVPLSGDACGEPGRVDVTASLEIISLVEGTGRSVSIPKLLVTPRATLELAARLDLCDARDGREVGGRLIRFRLSRGTGFDLVPPVGDEDMWVPPVEARRALREAASRRLAREAEKAIFDWLDRMPGGPER